MFIITFHELIDVHRTAIALQLGLARLPTQDECRTLSLRESSDPRVASLPGQCEPDVAAEGVDTQSGLLDSPWDSQQTRAGAGTSVTLY
jgi:hypothetical protein